MKRSKTFQTHYFQPPLPNLMKVLIDANTCIKNIPKYLLAKRVQISSSISKLHLTQTSTKENVRENLSTDSRKTKTKT